MKTLALLGSLLLGLTYAAPAQTESDTIFLNAKGKRVNDLNKAAFYQLHEKTEQGYLVWRYYPNHNLKMTGLLLSINPEIKQDSFKYYHENGVLSAAGIYVNNKRSGRWHYYNPDGTWKNSLVFKNDIAQPQRVLVRFMVDTQGEIRDITILEGMHPLVDQEAIKTIQEMPQSARSKIVEQFGNDYVVLPIKFTQ
jgi:TonB family protein